MRKHTRKIQWIIPIIAIMIIGNVLTITAMQNPREKNVVTPDLFDIGTFNLNINVSKTEFTPAAFTVKESATVNLTVTSVDIGHSFVIEEYGIERNIIANSTEIITFEANTIGTFTYSSENCTASGSMTVEDAYVPGLPRAEEVNVLIDFKHYSASAGEVYDEFEYILNWTGEDSGFNFAVNNNYLGNLSLGSTDVLIIFKPDLEFQDYEIENILEFVRAGGGLLIAGSHVTAEEAENIRVDQITMPFGFKFNDSIARYINSTNLSNPIGENNTLPTFQITDFLDHPVFNENQYVPLTQETVSGINYIDSIIEYNESWAQENLEELELTAFGETTNSYVLAQGNETIFGDANNNITVDQNETIGAENVFIVGAETKNNGRVLGIGSADIFNNSQVGRNPENEIFYQRALQWLAKMYSVIHNNDYEVSSFSVSRGAEVNASAIFTAQNNTLLENMTVKLQVIRSSLVELEINMSSLDGLTFSAVIDTSLIKKGTVYVKAIASKEGYGFNETSSFYIQINPADPDPLKVSVLYIITYVLATAVGIAALSLFFVRVLRAPKVEKEPSSARDDSDSSDITEEDEEIDLDEYETD